MSGLLEGVKVGPLDPDATERFGQVAGSPSAKRLIRLHARMMPPELWRALVRKLDEPRTAAVLRNLDEVREHLSGLELDNGDPVLPDGAVLEGANVRGEPGTEQVLTFTYRVKSGRSAKWFVPYDGDALPVAHEMGSELHRIARAKELGVVAWDDQGHSKEVLDRENRSLRRQVKALRDHVEARDGGGEVPDEVKPSADARDDGALLEETSQLRVENQELRVRLAAIESALSAVPGGADALLASAGGGRPQGGQPADEPYEGYDEHNAEQVIAKLRSEDASTDDRERILEYERAHSNRKTVVHAAETALDHDRE